MKTKHFNPPAPNAHSALLRALWFLSQWQILPVLEFHIEMWAYTLRSGSFFFSFSFSLSFLKEDSYIAQTGLELAIAKDDLEFLSLLPPYLLFMQVRTSRTQNFLHARQPTQPHLQLFLGFLCIHCLWVWYILVNVVTIFHALHIDS